jgi:hypothetical protein
VRPLGLPRRRPCRPASRRARSCRTASHQRTARLAMSMRVTPCRAHEASAGEEAAAVVMGAAWRRASAATTTQSLLAMTQTPFTLPPRLLSTSLRFACLQRLAGRRAGRDPRIEGGRGGYLDRTNYPATRQHVDPAHVSRQGVGTRLVGCRPQERSRLSVLSLKSCKTANRQRCEPSPGLAIGQYCRSPSSRSACRRQKGQVDPSLLCANEPFTHADPAFHPQLRAKPVDLPRCLGDTVQPTVDIGCCSVSIRLSGEAPGLWRSCVMSV